MRLDINLVVYYTFSVIVFLSSFGLYAFLAGMLFPSLLLKPKFKGEKARDRGLKKYTFDGGRAIVYRPDVKSVKYIEQYILSCIENNAKTGDPEFTTKDWENYNQQFGRVEKIDIYTVLLNNRRLRNIDRNGTGIRITLN